MLSVFAGRLTHLQASVGSILSVLALLYAFWYLGKAWPAVATAGGGFFSMQQAIPRLSSADQLVAFQYRTLHDAVWLLALVCHEPAIRPHLQLMSQLASIKLPRTLFHLL